MSNKSFTKKSPLILNCLYGLATIATAFKANGAAEPAIYLLKHPPLYLQASAKKFTCSCDGSCSNL